jgi:hypothetical protein
MRLCNDYRAAVRLDLDEANEAIARSASPLDGRLVDSSHLRLMDAIHERTDTRTEIYVRCAARQIPKWDHYLDIPTPNDRRLVEYLKTVVAALPAWQQPPPPCHPVGGGSDASGRSGC